MAGKKVNAADLTGKSGKSKKESKKDKKEMKKEKKKEKTKLKVEKLMNQMKSMKGNRTVMTKVEEETPHQDNTVSSSTDKADVSTKFIVRLDNDTHDPLISDPRTLKMAIETPASLQPFGYQEIAGGKSKSHRRVSVQTGQSTIKSITQNTDNTTKVDPMLVPKPAALTNANSVKVDVNSLDNDKPAPTASDYTKRILPNSSSNTKFLHQPSMGQPASIGSYRPKTALRVGGRKHFNHKGSPMISAIAVNVHSESSSSDSSNSSSDSSDSSDSEDDIITTDKPVDGVQSNIVSSSTPDIHISPHLKPATHGSHGLTYELAPITSNKAIRPYDFSLKPVSHSETQFTRVMHPSSDSNHILELQTGLQASYPNPQADSSTDSIQDMTAAVKRLVNDPTKISCVKLPESTPNPMTFRDRSKIVGDMTNDALALKHQSLNESYQNAIYDPDADKKSIVVNNVHYLTADIELRRHFEIIGTITRVTICKDRFTGKPAGRAYIQFHDSGSVALAAALDQTNFNGRPITVSPKYNPNGPPSSNTTFTTNTNTSATVAAPRPNGAPAGFRPQTSYGQHVRPQRQSKYNWVNPALAATTPAPPSTTQ